MPGRSAYTIKRRWYRLQRRGFINYLELYRSAYTTKRLSLQTMVVINKTFGEGGFINYLELIDLPTNFRFAYGGYKQEPGRSAYTTKRLWNRLQRRGFINYLELYRSAYHQKTRVSPTNNGGYKQELDRSAYTTKRLWFRLQRRGFINYLELYRSAYTTKRRLQTMVLSPTNH